MPSRRCSAPARSGPRTSTPPPIESFRSGFRRRRTSVTSPQLPGPMSGVRPSSPAGRPARTCLNAVGAQVCGPERGRASGRPWPSRSTSFAQALWSGKTSEEYSVPAPTATWNPARSVWEKTNEILLCGHAAVLSGTFPSSGMTQSGAVYELPPWEHPTPDIECSFSPGLPTPRATRGGSSTESLSALFPTPRATDGTKGGPNQRGSSGDLMLPSVVAHLFPTPRVSDTNGAGAHGLGGPDLRTALSTLFPTPKANDVNSGGRAEALRKSPRLASVAANLLPTPVASDGDRSSKGYARGNPTPPGAEGRIGESSLKPSAGGSES